MQKQLSELTVAQKEKQLHKITECVELSEGV